jgi:hypothetical protein
VILIALSGIFQRSRIEVPEMMRDEVRNSFHVAEAGYWFQAQFKGIFGWHSKKSGIALC